MEQDNNQNNPTNKAEAASSQPRTQQPHPAADATAATQTTAAGSSTVPDPSSRDQDHHASAEGEGGSHALGNLAPQPTVISLPVDFGPGFADVNGDVGGSGHNETSVDIIAVPCPGADPIQTWTYHVELDSEASIPSEAGSQSSLRRPEPWVTRKLRGVSSIARVFLYRHRALANGMTLQSLSEDLLEQVDHMREGGQARPLFFIGHSIGGLVVKNALVMANHHPRFQTIVDNCHGVSFFGTPHQGSSYMSMPNLKESIRELLGLQATLPQSLSAEVSIRNPDLADLHDRFVDMASEFRLWAFYETRESTLSGSAAGLSSEVQFGAPLVSVKSALLDVWQEDVYAVDSDHARLASFGPNNAGILDSYLADISKAIMKAARLSAAHSHTALHLRTRVNVEVIGFYEDPDAMAGSPRQYAPQQSNSELGSVIRLYSTKHPFKDFLRKGPDRCLAERLHKGPRRRSIHRSGAIANAETDVSAVESGGIPTSLPAETTQSTTASWPPEIVITSPGERPPLLRASQSEQITRPSSPESNASVSTTVSDTALPFALGFGGDEPRTIDMLAKQQAKILMKEHDLSTTAGFSRPNPSQRKFAWVHMPFNNPVWVKELFGTLERTQGLDFSRLFDYDNWVSKQIQNRNSESQPAYLKTICKYLSAADRLTSPRVPSPLFTPSTPGGITPNCLYLYLPYLHFDTYHSMIRRRKLIAKRRRHGRSKPVPEWVAGQESHELKMIWEYIGFDPPLNCRRTLDQFGHHSLRDTNSRDDDQMLYKLTKKDAPLSGSHQLLNGSSAGSLGGHSLTSAKDSLLSMYSDSRSSVGGSPEIEFGAESGSDLKNGHVLMVDQLWLWSVDMSTLVTFFPKRESSPTEGTLFQQADLRNSIYNELNGDLTGRTENTLDLAALIVWHAVTVLIERSSHPDLEIFRVFDEAIGMLAERMTLNMKRFRVHALDGEGDDDESESDYSDDEGESPAAIKKRHRRELERSERENRENTSALLELRDLEDELTTLQKLFDMQESTIKQMREIYQSRDLRDITRNGQDYLDEALEYVDEYKQQVAEMLKRVDTTRNDYEKMLEMVQRQAQVDEVRWSRLQAELASSQNLSVMIFTTFTVIFLPLTFFTGLFGMNTIEWQEENVPSLREIGAISLPSSLFLIVVSLVAAFSWRVQGAFKATYRGLKGSWKLAKGMYAERLEPMSRKEAKRRRREEKRRRLMEAKLAHDDESYDFWAMVKRRQRAVQYRIPEQNVNGAAPPAVLVRRKRT